VLAEEGYAYSSSVAPVAHDHYGWPEAPRFAHRPLPGSALIELPVTTVEVGGRRMAAGGGGFFRLLPYRFSSWAIGRVNEAEQRPAIFYFHPWEIDPGQPRVGSAVALAARHYSRLSANAPQAFETASTASLGPHRSVRASERPGCNERADRSSPSARRRRRARRSRLLRARRGRALSPPE
jgi:hypothetical protein